MRNKLNSNPHAMRGGAVLAFLIIAIGSIMLLLYLPLALLQVRYMYFVTSTLGLLLVIVGWGLLTSAHKASRQDAQNAGGKQSAWDIPLTIGAILLTALWGYWSMKSNQWDKWEDKDEGERSKAPAWTRSLETLKGGTPWQEIRDTLSKEGYRMRCYALKPNEGVEPEDIYACWTIPNNAWGMHTRMLGFSFTKDGLRELQIDFEVDQWPAVKTWFDQQEGMLTGDFGRNEGGGVVIGKMLKSGHIVSSEPGHLPMTSVRWHAREWIAKSTCKGKGLKPEQLAIMCAPDPSPLSP